MSVEPDIVHTLEPVSVPVGEALYAELAPVPARKTLRIDITQELDEASGGAQRITPHSAETPVAKSQGQRDGVSSSMVEENVLEASARTPAKSTREQPKQWRANLNATAEKVRRQQATAQKKITSHMKNMSNMNTSTDQGATSTTSDDLLDFLNPASTARREAELPKGFETIEEDDEWTVVMEKIKRYGGVKWMKASGLGYYDYILPGGKKPQEGGKKGKDYVEDEWDLKAYVIRHSVWRGDKNYREGENSRLFDTPGRRAKRKCRRQGEQGGAESAQILSSSKGDNPAVSQQRKKSRPEKKKSSKRRGNTQNPKHTECGEKRGENGDQVPAVSPDGEAVESSEPKRKKRREHTSSSNNAKATKQDVENRRKDVEDWLSESMNDHFHPDVLSDYSKRLLDMGYDSKCLLEKALGKDELGFMKDVHRKLIVLNRTQQGQFVQKWIKAVLPSIQTNDLVSYGYELISLGFDSDDTMAYLETEDLSFMKKGHARVLMRKHGVGGTSTAPGLQAPVELISG